MNKNFPRHGGEPVATCIQAWKVSHGLTPGTESNGWNSTHLLGLPEAFFRAMRTAPPRVSGKPNRCVVFRLMKNSLPKTRRVSVEMLRSEFEYNPETGELRRKDGRSAARPMSRGYLNVYFGGKTYKAHIVSWAIYHGRYPKNLLDHINGNKTDNRIENLREANAYQNTRNAKRRSDNTSGIKGVYFHSQSGKWTACIRTGGRQITLGRFSDINEAAKVRKEAAEKFHKEFARHE